MHHERRPSRFCHTFESGVWRRRTPHALLGDT